MPVVYFKLAVGPDQDVHIVVTFAVRFSRFTEAYDLPKAYPSPYKAR